MKTQVSSIVPQLMCAPQGNDFSESAATVVTEQTELVTGGL